MTSTTRKLQSTKEQKQAQTYLVRGNIIGSLSRDMMLDRFFVIFAVQVLALSNEKITLFLTLVPLFILLRYPFLDLIRSIPRIYPTRAARSIQLFCISVMFILPLEYFSLQLLMGLATLFVFANDFMQMSVHTSLIAEVSTKADRGRFLGKLRTCKLTTAGIFNLFGFFFVGEQLDRGEHRVLLLMVMGLLLNAIYWFFRVQPTMPHAEARNTSGKGRLLHIAKTSKLLRRPFALALTHRILAWPILTLYLVGVLHLPANVLTLTIVGEMLGQICSVYVWGKRADAKGIRKIYLFCFISSLALYPILLFIPDFALLPYLGYQWVTGAIAVICFFFLRGILDAGYQMASILYESHYVNEGDGFYAINILTASSRVITSILVALGGLLLATFTTSDAPLIQESYAGIIWIDPIRLITIATITAVCFLGIWISYGINYHVKSTT